MAYEITFKVTDITRADDALDIVKEFLIDERSLYYLEANSPNIQELSVSSVDDDDENYELIFMYKRV